MNIWSTVIEAGYATGIKLSTFKGKVPGTMQCVIAYIFSLQLVSINLLERPQGTKVVWTDVGSLNISEGNGVEFAVTNVPFTGNYKILLRLYPKVRFRIALSLIRNNNEQ